jgi:hypothetical protein
LVDGLLRHICKFDDVWLTTAAEVARWHAEHGASTPRDHPINVHNTYVEEEQTHER